MLPVIGWALVYGDGSRYTNNSGPWRQAPDADVQVLVLYHANGYRTLTYGEDLYSLKGERATKRGDWTDDESFHALVASVIEEG